ncbi:MAG: DUF4332 domain-containing protein [Candidatus Lokiarchaeota archaeon]|nr:DUF4332 domain-containing protein [Candidatus Lokiarchaeota archaeon]
MKLIEIEGIGKDYAKTLEKEGLIETTDLSSLSWVQIKELAAKTKISPKLIDKWQDNADLIEIKGIGPEYADVLNQIGIDSIKELAYRDPQNTLKKIEELDKKKPDVIRKLPLLKDIEDWIKASKDKYNIKIEKEGPGMDIANIEGIGNKYSKKLDSAGYKKVENLLSMTKDDIEALAKKTGISAKLLDKWQEHADLMRIKGIGPEFADAINQIGVDSVKELAQRNPKNTLERLEKLDKEKPDILRKLPLLKDVEDWISQAKELK